MTIEPTTVPSAAFTGDEDLIRRMIVNLIDNAVRHAPAGSTVRVELDETATRLRDRGQRPGPGHPSRDPAVTSSSASTEAIRRGAPTRTMVPGSDWRWRAGSPTPMAATSRWRDRRRPDRRSSSRCRRPAEPHRPGLSPVHAPAATLEIDPVRGGRMDETRQIIPFGGLIATVMAAGYMVVQLHGQVAGTRGRLHQCGDRPGTRRAGADRPGRAVHCRQWRKTET